MASLFPLRPRIRAALICAAAFFTVTTSCATARSQSSTYRVPVLVELFTSEGCSDCPPADKLLERLDKEQFVPGAEAIVLSEHVTYWNHLGWRDPFSFDLMDFRQDIYGRQFGLSSVYTPQAVVDGTWQLVGSDERSLRTDVAQAAAGPKKQLALADAHWANKEAQFTVRGAFDPKDHLYAAVAADATRSEVARGENAGRTLHHVAVVRALKEFRADEADGRVLRIVAKDVADRATPLRLVVFVTDHKTNHVIAVAQEMVPRQQ